VQSHYKKVVSNLAYDGSIKIDTKIDTNGFKSGIDKIKSIAQAGVSAVTTTLAGITAALGAGATAAATVGSSFEAAMSKVSAISGATGDSLQSLTDKAKEMGAKTKFSASESASALQYMAMAGWNTESMLNGIDGIMNLAAADGLDLATTSDIVTDALTAFNLKASDSTHFADVLAKASSSANTNVSMLGESFKYVAPLAGTMGYSVEDVSLALGLMANASVKGSMAGTSLKTALSNLASPTEEMSNVMTQYGISISDAEGNALPLIDVMKQLREKFSGLSETEQAAAASTLFGKEAMSGMLAIINASDSDFDNLTKNINNADGAAQAMADTMQDNLQGQITILKSGLEGLGIEIYEGMSAPLQEAAVEAQNYVNRLTEAFKSGGLSKMIEEAGAIFGELAVKAAEAAPEMLNAAVDFLQAFVDGIANNADKLAKSAVDIIQTLITSVIEHAPDLIKAAKVIVSELVDNLNKLLPKELQAPVKEAVNTIKKSFENGGLKKAIDSVKNIVVNLGKAFTNVAKVVLPPLSKAVDFLADNSEVLLGVITSVYAAFKSYSIISTVTALITTHTAAVTAESLAEAAALNTITLKQIAVGALTGEITLATAAQYAWNLAMNLNPIGIVITAVAALAAGIAALNLCVEQETSSEQLLAESYEGIAEAYANVADGASNYIDSISQSGDALAGFNDAIIISNERQSELTQKMDEVQTEITEIARHAKEERTSLTEEEIQRLDDLFAKQKELADEQLKVQEAYQGVVKDMAKDLAENHDLSLEEYEAYSSEYTATAEQTRDDTVKAAEQQKINWLAEKRALIGTDEQYTDEWYNQQREAANKDYDAAVAEANTLCSETLKILQDGYKDRADGLKTYSENQKKYNEDIARENKRSNDNLVALEQAKQAEIKKEYDSGGCDTWLIEQKYDQLITNEKNQHNKKLAALNDEFTKSFDKNQQDQLSTWMGMLSQTELYGGKISNEDKRLVDGIIADYDRLPPECQENMNESMQGMIDKIKERAPELYANATSVPDNILSIFRKKWDIHSPSKEFKKIFSYAMQGGENGLKDEAPKLYKQADEVASTFTDRLQAGVSADGLVSKMRAAVAEGKSFVAEQLTANVVHTVDMQNADKQKVVLQGNIVNHLEVDGREFAVATAQYMSEELAWEGNGL
jgi:TP901 family phage tail tape measure protein